MKPRQRFTLFAVCLTFVFATGLSHAAGGYYQWLDDRGVPQYSERPPNDRPYTYVSTGGGKKASSRNNSARNQEEAVTVPGSVDEGMPQIQAQEKNSEYCQRARNNLKTLESKARIRILDPDTDDYRYLNEEEKASERQRARDMIAIHC